MKQIISPYELDNKIKKQKQNTRHKRKKYQESNITRNNKYYKHKAKPLSITPLSKVGVFRVVNGKSRLTFNQKEFAKVLSKNFHCMTVYKWIWKGMIPPPVHIGDFRDSVYTKIEVVIIIKKLKEVFKERSSFSKSVHSNIIEEIKNKIESLRRH